MERIKKCWRYFPIKKAECAHSLKERHIPLVSSTLLRLLQSSTNGFSG
jgi:hypothetical protein